MDCDPPAASSTVLPQGSTLSVKPNPTDELAAAEIQQPDMSHPAATPHGQNGPNPGSILTDGDVEMSGRVFGEATLGQPKQQPAPGTASNGAQQSFSPLIPNDNPDHAQPSHAETSGIHPYMAPQENAQHTFHAIPDDMAAAIHRGDGQKAATLIRATVHNQALKLMAVNRPPKRGKRAAKKGGAIAPPRPTHNHKLLAVRQVRDVVEGIIRRRLEQQLRSGERDLGQRPDIVNLARNNAFGHALSIMHEAYHRKWKTVDLDLVSREETRIKHVPAALEQKRLATDGLRARLEELGDGMIPPRSDYAADDTMMVDFIDRLRRREFKELLQHLKYFEGRMDPRAAAKAARQMANKANKQQEKQKNLSGLMDGLSRMSGFSLSEADNGDEANEADYDKDVDMDMDMAM